MMIREDEFSDGKNQREKKRRRKSPETEIGAVMREVK